MMARTRPARSPATADFGDVRGEFQALVSAAAVYDLSSRAKISLTGSDRVRWLNGMVTNNIRDLAARTWRVRFSAQSAGTYSGRFVRLQPGRVAAGRYRSVAGGEDPCRLRQVHHHGRRRGRECQRASWLRIGIAGPKSQRSRCGQRDLKCPNSSLCNLPRPTLAANRRDAGSRR